MTTIAELKNALQVPRPKPKSPAEQAMDRLVRRVLALLDAVDRTKSAMDGEVDDALEAKCNSWKEAVEEWSAVPYRLAKELRLLRAEIKAQSGRQSQSEDGGGQ